MSRSIRKNPVSGWTCSGTKKGEKKDKQEWHRRYRSANRQICNGLLGDVCEDTLTDVEFRHIYDCSDVWLMAKDGKAAAWDLLQSVKYLTGDILERRIRLYKCFRK